MLGKIGPYRIDEQLGAGGMGEVFKAYDDRLERWVAIKRIRGDRDETQENRERFQREARATAKLSHASIVHLYDIFRDGESDCIVMEYVEGVTLDTLIRNGPLEPAQAASLAYEIASGLTEAHSKGIIHRDLKVENIIVTPDGHAKILDFGLARPLLATELDESLTAKGQLVGTSRAMSPEYVSGEAIDQRSDLFSLGVLVYEAVTSHSPFKAHNTLATLRQIMLHRQTPAHLVSSAVPEELSAVIEKLLEKDPADRPQSAREVARQLGRISGKLSSGDVDRPDLGSAFTTTPTEVFTPSATSIDLWGKRRWLHVLAALLALGIAGTYLLTRWWLGGLEDVPVPPAVGDSAARERARIVLADFENRTGEPLLDDSIELAFRLGLEQSRYAYVLPRSQIQGALSRMEKLADTPVDRDLGLEIAQREGAGALVVGSIVKIGETYSLSAEIVDPPSGVNTFSTTEQARGQSEILAKVERVTQTIRNELGESLSAIEATMLPLEKVTTSNLEALKAYSLGVAKTESDSEAAIPLFEQALKLDHDFAMAHAKLATVYIERNDRTRALVHLEQALRPSDRLTEVEKLYVEGKTARWRGQPREVIEAWTLMSTLYPNELSGHLNLGMARWTYLNQFEEAAQAFAAAAAVAETEYRSWAFLRLGYCQLALGRYGEALATFEKIQESSEGLYLVDFDLVTEAYAAALQHLETIPAETSPALQLRRRLHLALYYIGQGRFFEAVKTAREVRKSAEEQGFESLRLPSQLTVIAAQERTGSAADLNDTLSLGTELAGEYLRTQRESTDALQIYAVALIGKLNARNGSIDRARTLLAQLSPFAKDRALAVWFGHKTLLEGEILAAEGKSEAAIERFQEAIAISGSFQAHESLARLYVTTGRAAEAVAEYRWLVDHRGRGFVECLDECEAVSLIDSTLAFYHLGRLHELADNREQAAEVFRLFLQRWSEADDVAVRQDAQSRLASLG